MSDDDRLTEVARILATGILRLRLKKAKQPEKTEHLPLDNRNRMAPYGTSNPIDMQRKKP
ncbi:MAG: hypothetical protein H7835_19400 [Magnetococcus sp. XQGC-1]